MKRDTASASSRPNSAEHEGKRNNRDGRATADEHGKAESNGGEDSDSGDEDYEDDCGDDNDCGYAEEEEYNSDSGRYDTSRSFDPKPFENQLDVPVALSLLTDLSAFRLQPAGSSSSLMRLSLFPSLDRLFPLRFTSL